jgi:hypothetical protein
MRARPTPSSTTPPVGVPRAQAEAGQAAVDPQHPAGRPWGSDAARCGGCAWARLRGPGPRVLRCEAAGGLRVEPGWRACDRHEPPLDCLSCGACCGPAYDVVEVSPRDPVRTAAPALLERREGRWQVRRAPGNRCAALREDSLHCTIYEHRPRCCRELERGGPHCLWARRRLGLSPRWAGPASG